MIDERVKDGLDWLGKSTKINILFFKKSFPHFYILSLHV